MVASEAAVAAVGVGEGVRVKSDDRVEAEMAVIRTRGPERRLVVRGNAGEVLLHDGAAAGAAIAEGLLGFCDGGFGDLEGLGTGWWLRVCGGGDEEQKSEELTSHALSIFVRLCLNSATAAPRKIN